MLFRPPIGGNLNSIFLVGNKKIKQVNFEGGFQRFPEEYPSLTPSAKFPYLAWGQFHCIGKGTVYLNNALYPLSWESDASQADYQKITVVDDYFVNAKTSPTHTWCASELFMYIISKNRL